MELISFVMQVYKDLERADWCLTNLRKHYPDAPVLIVSDGDNDSKWVEIAQKHNTRLHYGERLYPLCHGGKMLHRNYSLLLEVPAHWYVKIDSDTGIHRPFNILPTTDGIYGTIQSCRTGHMSIQGGCIIFTHNAVKKLVESNIFLDKKFSSEEFWLLLGRDIVDYDNERIFEDHLTGYAVLELGMVVYNFAEVNSNWKGRVENPLLEWAVTHPCKDMRL